MENALAFSFVEVNTQCQGYLWYNADMMYLGVVMIKHRFD